MAITNYYQHSFLDQLTVLEANGYTANFPAHRHDVFSLTLVRSGFETTRVHGKELRTLSGYISLTSPNEIHANPNLNNQSYNFTTFYTSPDLLRHLNGGLAYALPTCILEDPQLFQDLLQWQSTPNRTPARFSSLMRRLLFIGKQAAILKATSGVDRLTHLPEILAHIEANLDGTIRLRDLAYISGLSEAHFLRVFKQQRGITPLQFVTLRRVERAKEWLLRGYSPAQAALQVGFYDQSHFHRFFLRYTGITPGQFLRSSNIVQYRQS